MNLNIELAKQNLKREELFALYTRAVEERFSPRRLTFSSPDELLIECVDGRIIRTYLENLWLQCRNSSEPKIDIFERHIAALASILEAQQQPTTRRENIVPTIKDFEYLALFGPKPDIVREHLAGDIWVVYAVDSPEAIKTLAESELRDLKISADELRVLAVDNLKRILPEIQQHGGGPWYMLTAGGDYTASILLLDTVWEQLGSIVEGDIVAAVPARDVLLFTGSRSSDGMAAIRHKAREIVEGADHIISQTLLRRTATSWKVFE